MTRWDTTSRLGNSFSLATLIIKTFKNNFHVDMPKCFSSFLSKQFNI